MSLLERLFRHRKPHKETLIDTGPWGTGSLVTIYNALLEQRHYEGLSDFTEAEAERIFGYTKEQLMKHGLSMLDTYHCYRMAMVLIAQKLRAKHRELSEVRCSYEAGSENPWRIRLTYEDGHKIDVRKHSGYVDITMIKFGYRGTGPDCFYVFLGESGFNVSLEDIENIKAPCTLRRKEDAGRG